MSATPLQKGKRKKGNIEKIEPTITKPSILYYLNMVENRGIDFH